MTSLPEFIPQMRPLFGEEEKLELMSYLDEDGFFTEYKKTEAFEQKIAEFVGAKHCVVVNNGTVSLTLAAIALGIAPGDEVIVPTYTMVATPNSLKMIGAVPVFIDVEPETLIMNIEHLRNAITKRTKAIILVTANGRAPKSGIKHFEALSEETGIPIIEDAAQSLGSFYADGRHIGRAGCIGSFSFSAPKIISTGQGGALITDNDFLAQKIRRLKDFGRAAGGTDLHDSIGYNFKFTELQACVGLAQMEKLASRLIRKKEIWSLYQHNLGGSDRIRMFEHDLTLCTPWFIDALCDKRDELSAYLRSKNIGTRPMYPRITHQKAYDIGGYYPIAEMVETKGLWLPSMVQITNEQIQFITNSIQEFYIDQ